VIRIPFDNTYARLPERFFTRTKPTPVAAPRLIRVNRELASELGIDGDLFADGAAVFSGNELPEGAEPISIAYAGHQFGSFVPQLGDGRAILLGEVIDRGGVRRDIQLKGSGRTPWSRGGDGRAAIGPVLREYVLSESMAALGIRTTRALAAATTGQPVYREEAVPGAVLTRVASSHIRVGTFQYFASRGDVDGVRVLADYAIARHYPDVDDADRYRSFLAAVIDAQATLIADWLLIGFIHGVMNTDNMSVSGETIDYGPCAFMDEYDPATVFSSIDRGGRYAYGRQPAIGGWNLARLAECLLPLISADEKTAIAAAEETLDTYVPAFQRRYHDGLRAKLGLFVPHDDDVTLANDLLLAMGDAKADFTLTFRALCDAAATADDSAVERLFREPVAIREWLQRWRQRLAQEPADAGVRAAAMRKVNPAFIPRNHRVEAVIRAAVDADDFAPFEELLAVLAKPYDDQPEHAQYAQPPAETERVLQTFCGT
jgi:uncharacterized protein YdiU (UPF0061 family)